jgi:hypothetical protein
MVIHYAGSDCECHGVFSLCTVMQLVCYQKVILTVLKSRAHSNGTIMSLFFAFHLVLRH